MRLPKDLILDRVHNIATNIEADIKEELDMEATIHMEPLR